jgi:type II secretory pathway pseudopilin PulG
MTTHRLPSSRRGISLLEVLISIGILAIGLSSVVAIIPAARSQAARAVVLDRGSMLAANALADAATFGLLRPDSHVHPLASGFSVMIDPATTGLGSYINIKSATNSVISGRGIFSRPSIATKADVAYHRLFAESRDDVVMTAPPGPDDLPLNQFETDATGANAVVRSFEGNFSCMYFLQIGPPPASLGRVSVVVFHRRDTSSLAALTVMGSIANGVVTVAAGQLSGRRLSEIARPGVVVYVNDNDVDGFYQAASATVDSAGTTAFLTLSSPYGSQFTLKATELTFLPDSVGLAERTFVPESVGPYTQ